MVAQTPQANAVRTSSGTTRALPAGQILVDLRFCFRFVARRRTYVRTRRCDRNEGRQVPFTRRSRCLTLRDPPLRMHRRARRARRQHGERQHREKRISQPPEVAKQRADVEQNPEFGCYRRLRLWWWNGLRGRLRAGGWSGHRAVPRDDGAEGAVVTVTLYRFRGQMCVATCFVHGASAA